VGDDFWCTPCRSYAFRCCLCEQVLRGMGFFCPGCGHGGHGDHIKQWFLSSPDCPMGCGCRCADYTFETFTGKGRREGGGGGDGKQTHTLFDEATVQKDEEDEEDDDDDEEEEEGEEEEEAGGSGYSPHSAARDRRRSGSRFLQHPPRPAYMS
jgi:hypothetical protein